MGLNVSSDKWCRQSDVLIRGIPWARKIVDDTLIWVKGMEELVIRTRIILDRCRENNITISQEKLELGKRIHFAGHINSDEGIQPDKEKYAAISRFPRPGSVKDLRSFFGLAQQLASFVPDLAHMTSMLRPLLKKDIAWTWTDNHEKSFQEVKNLLTSKTIIRPFD